MHLILPDCPLKNVARMVTARVSFHHKLPEPQLIISLLARGVLFNISSICSKSLLNGDLLLSNGAKGGKRKLRLLSTPHTSIRAREEGEGEKGLPNKRGRGTESLTVASALVPTESGGGTLGGDLSWGLCLLSLVNPLMG